MMESPPSVEETVACIATLYHNPNPDEKSQANQWLQILQNSVFAWKVSLLASDYLQSLDINEFLIF